MMNYKGKIVSDPDILLGKPVISGTRISVELILKKLAEGITEDQLLEAYPNLNRRDIMAVLAYSADVIAAEEFIAS
jgi:uncharacterized protein (DUF433 family)